MIISELKGVLIAIKKICQYYAMPFAFIMELQQSFKGCQQSSSRPIHNFSNFRVQPKIIYSLNDLLKSSTFNAAKKGIKKRNQAPSTALLKEPVKFLCTHASTCTKPPSSYKTNPNHNLEFITDYDIQSIIIMI